MLSLYLSDGEETPELSNDFISYGLTLNRFINLKSFSLFRLHSISTLNKLLINVYQPFHLTHLQIIQCYFGDIGDFNRLIINIWRLPNLRHYKLIIYRTFNSERFSHLCKKFGSSIQTYTSSSIFLCKS